MPCLFTLPFNYPNRIIQGSREIKYLSGSLITFTSSSQSALILAQNHHLWIIQMQFLKIFNLLLPFHWGLGNIAVKQKNRSSYSVLHVGNSVLQKRWCGSMNNVCSLICLFWPILSNCPQSRFQLKKVVTSFLQKSNFKARPKQEYIKTGNYH